MPAVRATRVPPIAAVREGAALPGRAGPRGAPPRVAVAADRRGGRAPGARRAGRRRHLRAPARARRRLAAPVHRRRDDLVAPRAPDRRPGGLAGRAPGRASGRLARQNAVRNPARTAATAAALMVGLALVTFVSVVRHGPARHDREGRGAPGRRRLRRHLHQRLGPAPAGRRAGPRRLAGGGTVSSVRQDSALVEGSRAGRRAASTRRRSARSTASTGPRARTRRSPRWTATARSSSGRSPRTTTWRSARRSSS